MERSDEPSHAFDVSDLLPHWFEISDRRRTASGATLGLACLLTVAAFVLPNADTPVNYESDGEVGGEVMFGVYPNLVPHAVVLLVVAVTLAIVSVFLRPREPRAYVGLALVLLLAPGVLATLAPRLECWESSHMSGPFEDDYSCIGDLDGLVPARP